MDYGIKISFVELYNEELRDHIASELSAPAGSTQPMGKGGSDANTADSNQGGVKIFNMRARNMSSSRTWKRPS
jgi:kinesin family member 11